MRILVAADAFDGGGAERVASWLCDGLSDLGHDVHAWASSESSTMPLRLARSADIVHVHTRKLDLVAAISGATHVRRRLTLHHHPRRFPWLRGRTLTSSPSKRVLEETNWPNATFIPSPILGRWTVVPGSGRRLVYVGRIEKDKGWRKWLDVLRIASEREAVAGGVVYGDGSELPEMEKAVCRLGVQVDFRGWVPSSAIAVFDDDVLALTSPSEADPLVIWEALATGIAVVSTPVGDLGRSSSAPWAVAEDSLSLAECVSAALRSTERVRQGALEALEDRKPEAVLQRYCKWYESPYAS